MSKKVTLGLKPVKPTDKWVEDRGEPEKMKRLTIDIPSGLHRAIKSQCAMQGKNMADEIRELLLQKYGS